MKEGEITMFRPVKIAQIGIGHNHGSAKMECMRRFPQLFDVVGVCESDASWRKQRQGWKEYQGIPWMSEEEILNLPGLEAVCVEADVPHLNEVARKCVDRGLHIHMDKPAGERYSEFEAIISRAREQNLVVQLAYMYRYNPCIRYCLDMVKSGKLGQVFEIDAQMSAMHPDGYRKWLEQYRGGDMYIFGSHLIDLIVCMLGEPTRVVPFLKNSFPENSQCVDNALAVLEYPRASCTVRCTSAEPNGYYRRQLVVCGSEGTIEIKPLEKPTIISYAKREDYVGGEIHQNSHPDARVYLDIPVTEGRYDAQMRDFALAVRGEIANPFDYDHELATHRSVLRACGLPLEEETMP